MTSWRGTLNRWRRKLAGLLLHRVVFGEVSGGRWLPHTRIAPFALSLSLSRAASLYKANCVFSTKKRSPSCKAAKGK